jgi:hypothetical protein
MSPGFNLDLLDLKLSKPESGKCDMLLKNLKRSKDRITKQFGRSRRNLFEELKEPTRKELCFVQNVE